MLGLLLAASPARAEGDARDGTGRTASLPTAIAQPEDGALSGADLVRQEASGVSLRRLSGTIGVHLGTAGLFILLRLWRLPMRTPLQFPGAGAGALALAAMAILLQPVGASAALAIGGLEGDGGAPRQQALAMLGAILAQLPVIVIAMTVDWRGEPRASRLGAAMLGAGAALLAMPAVAATAAMASPLREELTGRPFDPIAHDTLRMIVDEPGGWSTLLAGLAVAGAPVAEEVLYRGLGHDLLRRLGLAPWSIIGVVSLLFALAHASVATAPALAGLFVLGLALGWSRERSGSLLAPIIGHALFNAVNLWLAR